MTNKFDEIISCCRDLFLNFPGAQEVVKYADERLSKNGQEKFSFGYFPSHEHLHLLMSAIGRETLIELDLAYDKIISGKRETFSTMENHNLIMPYRDVYGSTVAIVGRTLLDDTDRKGLNIPKYKNTSFNKGAHLFGLFEGKKSIIRNNLVYLVEGQFDCLAAHDNGMENIVALGSSGMTFEQLALILRYTNNIILLLDNDEAGKMGAERIMRLYSNYANIRTAQLPEGYKDICEYLGENDIGSLNLVLK